MDNKIKDSKYISELVIHQLKSCWLDVDENIIQKYVPLALEKMNDGFKDIPSKRFSFNGQGILDPLFSVHWMIFLYRLSKVLCEKRGGGAVADQVYYLNKIMHSIDWLHGIDLPVHFLCEHPLGSVLGRADYEDWLLVYQGTTVGGSIKDGVLFYPKLGSNVVLFSNSSVLGKSIIGNNVMISSGTKIVNQNVPDNSIVFGESPNLIIKQREETTMVSLIDKYWR